MASPGHQPKVTSRDADAPPGPAASTSMVTATSNDPHHALTGVAGPEWVPRNAPRTTAASVTAAKQLATSTVSCRACGRRDQAPTPPGPGDTDIGRQRPAGRHRRRSHGEGPPSTATADAAVARIPHRAGKDDPARGRWSGVSRRRGGIAGRAGIRRAFRPSDHVEQVRPVRLAPGVPRRRDGVRTTDDNMLIRPTTPERRIPDSGLPHAAAEVRP